MPATAQGEETISLQTLGYSRSVVLQGSNPELNVGIPAPSGGIDPSASFVQLRLEPSPVLGPGSTVRVLINQEPMEVFSVGQLQANPVVQVPIPELPPGERFINLSVQPFLTISGDICRDIGTGNLFLTVGRESFFQVVPRIPDSTVADFFRPLYSQLSLVVPANLSPESAEAALWLYSLLAHQFPRTPILWTRGSASGPQVVLESPDFSPQLQRQGSTLRVAARAEAIQALVAEWERPGLLSRSIQLSSVPAVEPESLGNRRSLRQLGFGDPTLRGMGTQSLFLNFDLAQLGGRPQDLALQLNAVMTPVDGRLGDRLNGQVFLNGILLKTYDLTGRTQLNDWVALPSQLLRRANTLELRFDHAPSQGSCQGAVAPLTLQLQGDSSAFSWSGYEAPVGELQEIPALLQGSGQLVVGDPDLMASAAYLLGALSRLSPQPLLPRLQLLSEPISRSPLGDASWGLIVAGPEQVELNTPIRLGSRFEILNPLNQRAVLAVQPEDELGLLQYVLLEGKPTLWLSWWGSDPAIAERLSRSLADPRTLLANQMQGNVVTGYAAAPNLTQVQSWDLSGQTYQVRYPDRLDWRLLLWRYRFWLVILVALLGAGVAWSLYQRLAQMPQVPSPPPQP
ncbi:cellulose biosynthesis cyclic di-GMP-binding regulatory protein BcsB [Synechococcus bigranulatus str. 'Rupite']|uniref:Cellulose biosynthesis cyclic di-GMP-binding regulatory protein BcsB n=1 Tax=Thermostichus vulcanus str. 'Rupite' TaxID=2813851 RepID=A0ABT0CBN7_THEVL|nr:cellulose biosynthesis cyclic di-GMP-binding regulatory protein BcsB [Thermostichus vulcanus]MCJ2543203.1 cellulose biosynthesis cyclic di-GMP-binding regulatory protein BcsB [Thermostichus vulcanus str. 'Rupite']